MNLRTDEQLPLFYFKTVMRDLVIISVCASASFDIEFIPMKRTADNAAFVAMAMMQLSAGMRAGILYAEKAFFQPADADHFLIDSQFS